MSLRVVTPIEIRLLDISGVEQASRADQEEAEASRAADTGSVVDWETIRSRNDPHPIEQPPMFPEPIPALLPLYAFVAALAILAIGAAGFFGLVRLAAAVLRWAGIL